MEVKNQYFIILMITLSLFIGNGEAGWKFWKKDKETTATTSTTTSVSINVQSTTAPTKTTTIKRLTSVSIVNTEATIIAAANSRLDIGVGVDTTRENMQTNVRPNPRTEFGTDIDVSRSNRPEIGRENDQNYRNLAVDLIGVSKEPLQNQSLKISQESTVNSDGEDRSRTTSEGSTQPAQSKQYNRALSKDVGVNVVASTTTRVAAESTRKIYSGNPTYSRGNIVTDEDLEKLSEALYIKETNNANRYTTVNLQKQTTSSNLMDQASQLLLTISPEAFQIPTIQKVLSIFDNYQLDTRTNEYINPSQRQEESLLVDTYLSTNVMSAAMRFLADKGFVKQDYYEYKDILRRIWFNLFSRGQGKIGSTGFEHVFMAETKQIDSGIEVLGLHNWIYFNAEEIQRRVDYLGYIKKTDLGNKGSIIKMHVKFNGHDKPVTTMFIGTSPELEMALYTVCFYTRPDGRCPVSLGGTKFNIITRKFRYRGKDLVGTAYPEI